MNSEEYPGYFEYSHIGHIDTSIISLPVHVLCTNVSSIDVIIIVIYYVGTCLLPIHSFPMYDKYCLYNYAHV